MPDPYAYASFHVEDVVSGQQTIEAVPVGEAAEVYQKGEQQQFVGADQEPEPEQDLTNIGNTQGKHRCMIKPSTVYI